MPPTPSSTTTSDSGSHRFSAPYVQRHNRRFLREVPAYPLPVDLPELHRQALRTSLLIDVFGTPINSKLKRPPARILELICGGAVWSLKCDQHLKRLGYHDVSFTGVDIAPLAPDLRKYGVNWRFIQHDLRKPPLPFGEEFDLIMVSDGTTVMPSAKDIQNNPMIALKKYLRPGGCVEVIETDYIFRCLQPEPARPPGTSSRNVEQANKTATYVVGPATAFSKSPNPFFIEYNKWVEKVFQERDFTTTPCATMSYGVATEMLGYEKIESRRVAIPFTNIRWENDVESDGLQGEGATPNVSTGKKVGKGQGLTKASASIEEAKPLTSGQAALRMTALNIITGLIESMEPILMKESGKKQDEWDRWWSMMMNDLYEKNGAFNGECIEAGVWWARREDEESDSDDDD